MKSYIKSGIHSKDDWYAIFRELIPNHNQTILVRNGKKFVCGIHYSENLNDWVAYFNMYKSIKCEASKFFHILSMYPDLRFYLLPNKEALHHEIRHVINSHINESLADIESEGNILANIINDVKEDLGKVITINNDKGILILLTASLTDYYYGILTEDLELKLHSCVGGYIVTPIQNISSNLKSLMDNPDLDDIILNIRISHFMDSEDVEVLSC